MHNHSRYLQGKQLFIALCSLLVISGCSINVNDASRLSQSQLETTNRALIATLTPGTDISIVRQQFGIADFDDRLIDGHRILYYRTHHHRSGSKTTRDECTPLIFVDQKLVAWGQLALDKL